GDRAHQLVEGPLHVEEERVEVRTARPDPGERDAARTAGERGEAERVLQAMRRIDGQHGRPPAAAGRLDRERGGGGGLADPAAADAEDDAPALERVGERGHAARPAARASSLASTARPAGASGAPKRKGSRTGAAPSARRGAVSWASARRARRRPPGRARDGGPAAPRPSRAAGAAPGTRPTPAPPPPGPGTTCSRGGAARGRGSGARPRRSR